MPQKGELDWARRLTFPKKLRILTLTKLTDREESTMGGPKKHRLGYALAAAHQTLRRKRVVAAVYVLLRFLEIVTMVAHLRAGADDRPAQHPGNHHPAVHFLS